METEAKERKLGKSYTYIEVKKRTFWSFYIYGCFETGRFETGRFETWRFVNLTFCKPDVLKLDVLNPDVLKPDVLKPDVLWVYRHNDAALRGAQRSCCPAVYGRRRDTSFRGTSTMERIKGPMIPEKNVNCLTQIILFNEQYKIFSIFTILSALILKYCHFTKSEIFVTFGSRSVSMCQSYRRWHRLPMFRRW